jgi:hypothetical protein
VNKKKTNEVFIVLGFVWFIVGFVIYQNSSVWPLGFIFIVIGLIRRYTIKEERALH